MQKQQVVRLTLELIWWVITALIVWGVLMPIYNATSVWPFHTWNVIFIVTLVTFTRYIFMLEHTFVAHRQILKIALLLLMFPVCFMLINGVSDFMTYIDEQTWDGFTGHLPPGEKRSLEDYIWNEMLFFGVGSVIAAPVFAGRMMMSIWRLRNRGTV
jgi:hypothetical protein